MLAEDMLFIASSCRWQIFEGDDEEPVKEGDASMETLAGYVSMLRDPEYTMQEYWTALGLYKDAKYVLTQGSKCEEQEIWHPALMLKLDALYIKTVRPVKHEFGLDNSEAWSKAMGKYWKRMEAMCVEWWTSAPHGPSTVDTEQAQQYALAKLRWIKLLRETKQTLDLPWPTRSALEDMYEALFAAGFGVAYVSTRLFLARRGHFQPPGRAPWGSSARSTLADEPQGARPSSRAQYGALVEPQGARLLVQRSQTSPWGLARRLVRPQTSPGVLVREMSLCMTCTADQHPGARLRRCKMLCYTFANTAAAEPYHGPNGRPGHVHECHGRLGPHVQYARIRQGPRHHGLR